MGAIRRVRDASYSAGDGGRAFGDGISREAPGSVDMAIAGASMSNRHGADPDSGLPDSGAGHKRALRISSHLVCLTRKTPCQQPVNLDWFRRVGRYDMPPIGDLKASSRW